MIDPKLISLLLLPEGSWCQVYERFHVIFHAGKFLEITVIEGSPPKGKAISNAAAELPEGYELTLTGNKKGFSLKRLSNERAAVTIETAMWPALLSMEN